MEEPGEGGAISLPIAVLSLRAFLTLMLAAVVGVLVLLTLDCIGDCGEFGAELVSAPEDVDTAEDSDGDDDVV